MRSEQGTIKKEAATQLLAMMSLVLYGCSKYADKP
jgi:hypothetical protein